MRLENDLPKNQVNPIGNDWSRQSHRIERIQNGICPAPVTNYDEIIQELDITLQWVEMIVAILKVGHTHKSYLMASCIQPTFNMADSQISQAACELRNCWMSLDAALR